MYVQCERCKTEYDFDDALVSERGTTVKCTSCGHQFKVRRSTEGGISDKWTITTRNGKKTVYTTLRELQKAIMAKQIGKQDLLSRGDGPPRPLGTIAELEPFFDERRSSPPPPEEKKTPSLPPPPGAPRRSLPSISGPPRAKTDTLRPTGDLGAAVPPPLARIEEASSPLARTVAALDASYAGPNPALVRRASSTNEATPTPALEAPLPPPAPMVSAPPLAVSQPPAAVSAVPQPVHATVPIVAPPLAPVISRPPVAPELSPLPGDARASFTDEQPRIGALMDQAPRRRVGGWVLALALLVGVAAVAGFALRQYWMPAPQAHAPLDPQTEALVTDGERALSEGRLDDAKTALDKASAFAPRDARVLLDLARVETVRADMVWLDLRLSESAPQEERTIKQRQLEDLGGKAIHAADAAVGASPDDLSAIRVKIDALRVVSNLREARDLAPKIKTIEAQPETAYVLAALDLAEPGPQWKVVIDRLRSAAMGEGNLARAEALLIYALAKSGDAPGARKELERLTSMLRPHPLLGPLRAYLERAQPAPAAGDAGAPVPVSSLPTPTTAATAPPAGGGGADPRALLAQADSAKNRADWEKAKRLYGQVLSASPNDSEALAGLGDVARGTRDFANATTYYKQALAANSSFIPALVGLGDTYWDQGEKAQAKKSYKEIVDRFPEQAYPAHVKQRAEAEE